MKRLDQGLNVGDADLHGFADGYLEPGRHAAVIGHIAAHPEAADRLAGLLRHRAELAALGDQLEDAEPDPQIEALTQQLTAHMFRHRRLRRTVGASAVGLIAGVTFAGLALTRIGDDAVADAEPASPMLAAMMPTDATATTLASPPGGCLLGHRPDLQVLGLSPAAGDAPVACSSTTARLAYRDETGRLFSLVVSAGEAPLEPTMHDARVAMAWRSGAVRFTLMTSGDGPELMPFEKDGSSGVEAVNAAPVPVVDPAPEATIELPEAPEAAPEGSGDSPPAPVTPAVLGHKTDLSDVRVSASTL